jgi:hypothetical protein
MAARLLGIATRTIYRHLERQEGEDTGAELEETDPNAASDTASVQ